MHGSQVGWGALECSSCNIQPAPEAHVFSACLWERTVDSWGNYVIIWATCLLTPGDKGTAVTSVAGLAGQMGFYMLHERAAMPCMHGSQVGWGAPECSSGNIQPVPEAHMFSAYLWERTVDSVGNCGIT
ncbi:hypothetical protein NDU88_001653 [Pleurodeles waltl]|uniref:Uncharacterized protein n=1 Tax=Pleurodeles waltl TaxID=8319 RepID=A0AAV7W259_PLEWA|nr:hypothetical protein NDU88_001653 [Pleurodeles waltl]